MEESSRATLTIQSLRIWVHLGCTDAEREHPQPVDIDIAIYFPSPPLGCRSDELKDTICYAHIVDIVKKILEPSSFKLVEHLAQAIINALRRVIAADHKIKVTITKLKPPIAQVHSGIRFELKG